MNYSENSAKSKTYSYPFLYEEERNITSNNLTILLKGEKRRKKTQSYKEEKIIKTVAKITV